MKRIIGLIIVLMVITSNSIVYGAESSQEIKKIKVYFETKEATLKNPVISVNDSVLMSYDDLFPNLGILNDKNHIIWNSKGKSLTIIYGKQKILYKIDFNIANVSNKKFNLDAKPIIYKNKPYIPITSVESVFSKKVCYDNYLNRLYIRDMIEFKKIKDILVKSIDASQKIRNGSSVYEYKDKKVQIKDVYTFDCITHILHRKGTITDEAVNDFESYYINDLTYERYTVHKGNSEPTYEWHMKKATDEDINVYNLYTVFSNRFNIQDSTIAGATFKVVGNEIIISGKSLLYFKDSEYDNKKQEIPNTSFEIHIGKTDNLIKKYNYSCQSILLYNPEAPTKFDNGMSQYYTSVNSSENVSMPDFSREVVVDDTNIIPIDDDTNIRITY